MAEDVVAGKIFSVIPPKAIPYLVVVEVSSSVSRAIKVVDIKKYVVDGQEKSIEPQCLCQYKHCDIRFEDGVMTIKSRPPQAQ